jgi:site-specific DNA-methyltransferase (adenine-specific)
MRTFGTGPRVSYDSTSFYQRALYGDLPLKAGEGAGENPVPGDVLNRVFCQDSRSMPQLPDRSVHLMVTSPPYNVGKDYDDNLSMQEYVALLRDVFAESRRVLVPGGRACINVANLGRKPYIPLHRYVIEEMDRLGFFMRGEIIWDKSASAGSSTAWGSWRSAANPTLRDVHEYVLIFCKDSFSRSRSGRNTIDQAMFLSSTKSIWSFPAESARRVGHPAPFPVELPRRLIELYTFEGDVVLDPFGGSGSTAIAARETGRNFVLFDASAAYVRLAEQRIAGTAITTAPRQQRKRRRP